MQYGNHFPSEQKPFGGVPRVSSLPRVRHAIAVTLFDIFCRLASSNNPHDRDATSLSLWRRITRSAPLAKPPPRLLRSQDRHDVRDARPGRPPRKTPTQETVPGLVHRLQHLPPLRFRSAVVSRLGDVVDDLCDLGLERVAAPVGRGYVCDTAGEEVELFGVEVVAAGRGAYVDGFGGRGEEVGVALGEGGRCCVVLGVGCDYEGYVVTERATVQYAFTSRDLLVLMQHVYVDSQPHLLGSGLESVVNVFEGAIDHLTKCRPPVFYPAYGMFVLKKPELSQRNGGVALGKSQGELDPC